MTITKSLTKQNRKKAMVLLLSMFLTLVLLSGCATDSSAKLAAQECQGLLEDSIRDCGQEEEYDWYLNDPSKLTLQSCQVLLEESHQECKQQSPNEDNNRHDTQQSKELQNPSGTKEEKPPVTTEKEKAPLSQEEPSATPQKPSTPSSGGFDIYTSAVEVSLEDGRTVICIWATASSPNYSGFSCDWDGSRGN